MSLPLDLIRTLEQAQPKDAWAAILAHAWQICSAPNTANNPVSEVLARDRSLGELDLYLATASWDLWNSYETAVPRTSEILTKWWAEHSPGRAILILDAFSIRESPWILQEAQKRGYTVHHTYPTGAEIPADTTPFAKALGFSQRSSLSNNGAGNTHVFSGACTDSVDIAWEDCANLIGSEPDWVFWHHWPDHRIHYHDDPGKGIKTLTKEAITHLTGDKFWSLVERLATGRRLVITADHGYAASGLFPDAKKEQAVYLKNLYKGGRSIRSDQEVGDWVPPIDLSITSAYGRHLFVNGRRKWKSQGGYPTLTHGGLSILEVAVPFIEISRTE